MCKNIDNWDEWKKREIHKNKFFIADGAVDIDTWRDQKIKILFLMKEAYGNNDSLTNCLLRAIEKRTFGNASTFPNLIRWLNAIKKSNQGDRVDYDKDKDVVATDILRISVVNLKKSNGKSISDDKDLMKYVESDWDLLEQQIISLNPDFIICCGTFNLIRSKIKFTKTDEGCRYNKVKWKIANEPYIINFVHPAIRGIKPAHLYYSIASISAQ